MLQKLMLSTVMFFIAVRTGDDHLIDWNPSRKLTWNDFQAKPDGQSSDAALTSSAITVDFAYRNQQLTHSITCRFNKLKSWVRLKNDYILKHEQGHFDLAEGFARELHKELLAYTFNKRTFNEDIQKIYNGVMQRHQQEQELYDSQSNHSLDTAMQRVWNAKIAERLTSLVKYSDYK